MLIEVLGELNASREDEDFKLIIDSPRCFLHNDVLISSPNLDHGISMTKLSIGILMTCALENSTIGFSVCKVLYQDLVYVDINLAVSVFVNQMSA